MTIRKGRMGVVIVIAILVLLPVVQEIYVSLPRYESIGIDSVQLNSTVINPYMHTGRKVQIKSNTSGTILLTLSYEGYKALYPPGELFPYIFLVDYSSYESVANDSTWTQSQASHLFGVSIINVSDASSQYSLRNITGIYELCVYNPSPSSTITVSAELNITEIVRAPFNL